MSKKILDIFFGMFVYLAVCDLMHFQAWNSNTYWKVYCGPNKISAKYFQHYCPAHCCWFCSEQYSNVESSLLKICLSHNILCNRFKKVYQIFFKIFGSSMCRPSSKDPHRCEQKCFKFENREKSFRRHQSISKSQSNFFIIIISNTWEQTNHN